MKRTLSVVLALMMVLALGACGNTAEEKTSEISAAEEAASPVNVDESEVPSEEKPSGDHGGAFGDRGGKGTGSMGMGDFAMTDKSQDEVLQALIAETADKFQQYEYSDGQTGLSLPYNLFLPEDYDDANSYPIVVFIADMSVAGQEVTAPLTQGYGGIIWASAEEQAKHESIVLVPAFPETILDDHGGYTTTDYVEMTVRLIEDVSSKYAVDNERIYVTGQSMGCMTFLLLSSEYPDMFAAEIFVSGQWDVEVLGGIASQNCFYITAQGDPGGSTGQKQLYDYLTGQGTQINGIDIWDAGWSQEEFSDAVETLLGSGESSLNFASFATGTTLPEGASEGASEHMTSFDFAYKIDAVRDWLFEQSRNGTDQ